MKSFSAVLLLAAFTIPAFAQQSASSSNSDDFLGFGFAILIGYFIPTVIAMFRGVKSSGAVAALNILLGWTVIGWIAALLWAMSGQTESEAKAKTIDYEKLATALRGQQPPQR